MIVTHMAAITTQMPKPAPTKNEELLDSEPIKTETIHEKSSNSIVENETVVNEKANSCGLSDANIGKYRSQSQVQRHTAALREF